MIQGILDALGQAVLIAYMAVGLIEWGKAGAELIMDKERKLKSIIAWAVLPISAFAAAAAFDGGIWVILQRAGLALATAQIGYPILVKLPLTAIEKLKPTE